MLADFFTEPLKGVALGVNLNLPSNKIDEVHRSVSQILEGDKR